jgi:hypothetical protein
MAIAKKEQKKVKSNTVPPPKKTLIETKPAGLNIAEEVKEKYPFYVGRLYKRNESGGLYVLNAFSQDFDSPTQYVIIFTNPLNSSIFSMKAEKFLKEFELVKLPSKDK